MSSRSRTVTHIRIGFFSVLTVFGVITLPGCSDGPAAPNPEVQGARKKALAEDDQAPAGKGKGKNTSDLKNVKARILTK